MEDHGYAAVNSEKPIFMKHENGDWIMHGLFVDSDDMVHDSTSEKLKLDFIAEYIGDFEITCNSEDLMTSFLGMEVEQDKSSIRLHLDNYIEDTLWEHEAAIKKFVKPKQMPMQPGIVLEYDLCPETPDPLHCFTAGEILCISRSITISISSPRDGILGGKPQFQAHIPQGGRGLWTGRVCRK
jgi:hypothetical protein